MFDDTANLVKKFREFVSSLGPKFDEDISLLNGVKEAEKKILEHLNNSGRVLIILEDSIAFKLIFHEAYVTDQYNVFCPTAEMVKNNKKLVQPELQNAVEGEEEARIFYRNERIICFSEFSEETQTYILNHAEAFVKNQGLTKKHLTDPEIRSYYNKKELVKSFTLPKDFHVLSGITSIFTYSSGEVILEGLEGRQYEKFTQYKHIVLGGIRITEKFNPLSYGPIGKLAKDVFENSLSLMLKVRILEDLLDHLDFKITWTNKKQILGSYKEPWDLNNTNIYKNLLTLAEQRDAEMLDGSIIEEAVNNFRLLNSSNINAFIAKKRENPQGVKKAPKVINTSFVKPTVSSFHTKQSFIEGLLSSVVDPVESDKITATRLYSLYTRGMVTYPESILLLEKGKEPNADRSEINQFIEDLIKERGSLYSNSKSIVDGEACIDEVVAETSDITDENIVVNGRESQWFSCWLESISKSDQEYVQKRLDKVTEGLFGRHAQLRANRRLYELKVSGEKEMRIYFIYSGPKEITLIHAGIKDTQDKDIEYAIGLIK